MKIIETSLYKEAELHPGRAEYRGKVWSPSPVFRDRQSWKKLNLIKSVEKWMASKGIPSINRQGRKSDQMKKILNLMQKEFPDKEVPSVIDTPEEQQIINRLEQFISSLIDKPDGRKDPENIRRQNESRRLSREKAKSERMNQENNLQI